MDDLPDDHAPRRVPAPDLLEVAQTWWDVDEVPVVTWDADGTTFELVDPTGDTRRLHLLRLAEPAPDPEALAATLAEGLAACDFPPTGERASPSRVRGTLRAAGVDAAPAPGWDDADPRPRGDRA